MLLIQFRKHPIENFLDPTLCLMRKRHKGEYVMLFDPEKKTEYQLRLAASVVIFAMMTYIITTHGLRGPALFEVGLFGGAFATLTLFHSIWALWKIHTHRRE